MLSARVERASLLLRRQRARAAGGAARSNSLRPRGAARAAPETVAAVRFSPWLGGDRNPGASPWIASCSGESGRLKSGRARIVTGVIHFSSCSLLAGHVPWEHDGSWFDSSQLDCDVRELANPVHCECISDGIETRTSPKLSPAARARCLLSRSEARSTRAESK